METTATRTSSLSPEMSTFLAIVLMILIAYLLINKHRKKVGKTPLRISSLFGKKKNRPSKSVEKRRWYGNYDKLITVDAFKKISGKCYVVFDLETTGLDPDYDRIIEIGAVRVAGGEITKQTFQQLIDPQVGIPSGATEVNHITNGMVKGQPTIDEILPKFLKFVDGDILVAHNGGFDAAFLDNACSRLGIDAPKKYFDTMRLSVYWPNLKNRKLETFLKAAGIENERSHRALSDSLATAELCIKSMKKIK